MACCDEEPQIDAERDSGDEEGEEGPNTAQNAAAHTAFKSREPYGQLRTAINTANEKSRTSHREQECDERHARSYRIEHKSISETLFDGPTEVFICVGEAVQKITNLVSQPFGCADDCDDISANHF